MSRRIYKEFLEYHDRKLFTNLSDCNILELVSMRLNAIYKDVIEFNINQLKELKGVSSAIYTLNRIRDNLGITSCGKELQNYKSFITNEIERCIVILKSFN